MRKPTVSELIIDLFQRNSNLSVKDIIKLLTSQKHAVSQRAVYKELALLSDEGILVKAKSNYSLSITWVLKKLDIYKNLFNSTTQRSTIESLIASQKRVGKFPHAVWKFNGLELLDRFWLQLIFLLFERSISKKMYVWVPYFWFDLVHLHKDLEAQTGMLLRGNHMFMILGNSSLIDKLPQKYWNKKAYTWSYTEGPFESKRDEYYDVIDDWIISVKIDNKTTEKIDLFFKSIQKKEEIVRIGEFKEIARDAKCKISLEKNQKKAGMMLRKFEDFFG